MTKQITHRLSVVKSILRGILNSYSQVFFSDNKAFATLLLALTFLDWPLGVAGLIAVVVSNGVATWLGFDATQIEKGYFGFNALLAGLGLAIYYEPSMIFYLVLLVASLLCLFVSISLKGILGKYGLPFLSLPFIVTLWVVLLASNDFVNLGLSERHIFHLNTLYSRGGTGLISIYQWVEDIPIFESLRTYLKSLAAIFFQQNLFSGLLISLGLLLFSRIAFSLSLLGFYAALLFYQLIGVDFNTLNYTYIGFNYILTAIAIGGFFLIPSKTTYLWVLLIIPLVATFTISLSHLFALWNLSIYALPFNLVVILFLYVLKLRVKFNKKPFEVIIQNNSPEKNLYAWQNEKERFGNRSLSPIKLPFYGTWSVSQGHSGEITHRDAWQFAWDFVITNNQEQQYKNEGLLPTDYFCFNKAIIAPADGTVVQVINHIHDNTIGDINTRDNWGNCVIIKHNEHLYTKLCHLKENSIQVKDGEKVKFGTILGYCGNSGRSPYPHLHFQVQTTPFIGSPTLHHPIASYLKETENKQELHTYDIPLQGDRISNIKPDDLLSKAFHFIPGERLIWQDEDKKQLALWEVKTNSYNYSFMQCMKSGSKAWFENDGALFYFSHFEGDTNTLLYHFYRAAFLVQLGFNSKMEIHDHFPLNKVFNWYRLFIQDFVAPFVTFKTAQFHLIYDYVDNDTFPSEVELSSEVRISHGLKLQPAGTYRLFIQSNGIQKFTVTTKKDQITALCNIPV